MSSVPGTTCHTCSSSSSMGSSSCSSSRISKSLRGSSCYTSSRGKSGLGIISVAWKLLRGSLPRQLRYPHSHTPLMPLIPMMIYLLGSVPPSRSPLHCTHRSTPHRSSCSTSGKHRYKTSGRHRCKTSGSPLHYSSCKTSGSHRSTLQHYSSCITRGKLALTRSTRCTPRCGNRRDQETRCRDRPQEAGRIRAAR